MPIQNQTITKVIFRKFKSDGTIVALFPEIPAGGIGEALCASYVHVGQHGNADPHHVIRMSVPATEGESRSLKAELKQRGYILEQVQRCTPKMMRTRERIRAQIQAKLIPN